MEALIHLDTHVVAWLFAGETKLLSTRARDSIERCSPRISPMVVLELCDLPFPRVIAAARGVAWTRDPFDRVIVGQALAADRPLVTKDRGIRRRLAETVW